MVSSNARFSRVEQMVLNGELTLADAIVATDALADLAVTTAKLADLAVTTAKLADDAVTAAKINADVAGLGLEQAGSGALDVKVDGTTLEINADTVRVKADGITLGTHTVGNYLGTLAGTANQITSTGATSGEGITHVLSIPFATMTSFTPSLTATVTNPTNYGPNAQYGRLGDWAFMLFDLQPTGSFTSGSGNYRLSLPITATDAKYGFLIGAAYNSSNADPYLVNGWLDSSDSLTRMQLGCGANPDDTTVNNPNYGLLSNGFPFSLASGDWIRGIAIWKV